MERELIRARTGEGRKRAQERGVRFGRPRKLTFHQQKEALQRLAAGETQADIARTYNVDPTTIGRLSSAPGGTADLMSMLPRYRTAYHVTIRRPPTCNARLYRRMDSPIKKPQVVTLLV